MIKPTIFFILIICISGYLFAEKTPKMYYKLKRSSGYHTFLKSAYLGFIIFTSLSIVWNILLYQVYSYYGLQLSITSYFYYQFLFSDIYLDHIYFVLSDLLLFTFISSFLLPYLLYGSKEERHKQLIEFFSKDSESPEFTKLFFKSIQFGIPILFTMSDRKIYIGYVTQIEANKFMDVDIIPVYSGYRDKDDLKLVMVTPYMKVLDDLSNEKENKIDLHQFTVTLPIREILYAHLHDFEYYPLFKNKENKL